MRAAAHPVWSAGVGERPALAPLTVTRCRALLGHLVGSCRPARYATTARAAGSGRPPPLTGCWPRSRFG
ncbi:hypothetical protein SSAG_03478 [Streptomyces sp. Mg1]|nr:hypothetical protein SSAG_03478 [Streptomyces sp. Mg1]